MNFGFSEEQQLLRDEVRKFLDESAPLDEVRRLGETAEGYSPELWKQIAELGWTGLAIPEEFGGAGLGWVDLVILLEETGRSLFPAPLASTALAAAAILDAGSDEQKQRWLPRIAQGSAIGTLALFDENDPDPRAISLGGRAEGSGFLLRGEKRFVHDAGSAGLFVVAFRSEAGLSLAVLDSEASGLSGRNLPTVDTTKRLGTLALADVSVSEDGLLGEPGSAEPVIARLLDRGAIATTAEMIGAAEEAHRITTEYAKERTQFDSVIGRFQGVKHPLAEMYVDIESYKSLLYYAAWALEEAPEEVPRYASMAKAYASEAFARIGIDGVQLHGAVGYTDEYDIQLYLKRSKWARPAFGDADWHYERVAALGGL
ncbi:MAG: acyl-CoA/acyl-ACP dehydrogenase [Myxococcales bacterium]|nr:acyl-CoA/acyl-ACP dehydrogenase [Myxococcales bacterium]